MVKVGDLIRLSSMKGPTREGFVTAMTGSLVRVRWPSGDETTLVPAPGTLSVVATGKSGPQTAAKKGAAKKSGAKRSAATKSATPTKQPPKTTQAERPTP